MAEGIVGGLQEIINSVTNSLPEDYRAFVILSIYTLLIAIYAIFIWKFYRFLAKRDLLELNLRKYSTAEHPVIKRISTSALYFLEYIIILPVIVFLWFSILSVFIIVLSENQSIEHVLLIAASIVASVRLTAYFNEELSKDIAKLFPFTLLAIFLVNPASFSVIAITEGIGQIPNLLGNVFSYLLFIIGLELIMRILFLIIYTIWPPEEKADVTEEAS